MKRLAQISDDGRAVTIRVPLSLRKRGGRKLVTPGRREPWAVRPRVGNTLVNALARAFRWRKLLRSGVHSTIDAIAAAEMINDSCVNRVLRLPLLAPKIVEPC